MDRKSFTPSSFKADAKGAISVVFAKFNVIDKDREVTLRGAFGNQEVRIQPYGHDTSALSIGKGIIRENGDEAIMEGQLNLDMIAGREAYASLKFDLENGVPLQEWSYIFDVLKESYGNFEGESVRFLKQMKVYSVDPVFIGAGIDTRTTSVKSAGQGIDLRQQVALGQRLIEKAKLWELQRQFLEIKERIQPLYLVVDAKDVPEENLKVAEFVMNYIAPGWALGAPPELKWCRLAQPEDLELMDAMPHRVRKAYSSDTRLLGMTETGDGAKTIWLEASMTPWAVAHVAAHEMRHAEFARMRLEPKRWDVPLMSNDEEEADCQSFASNWVEQREDLLSNVIDGPSAASASSAFNRPITSLQWRW